MPGQRDNPGRRHRVDRRQQPAADRRAHQRLAMAAAKVSPRHSRASIAAAFAPDAAQHRVEGEARRVQHVAQDDARQRHSVAWIEPGLRPDRGGQRQHRRQRGRSAHAQAAHRPNYRLAPGTISGRDGHFTRRRSAPSARRPASVTAGLAQCEHDSAAPSRQAAIGPPCARWRWPIAPDAARSPSASDNPASTSTSTAESGDVPRRQR